MTIEFEFANRKPEFIRPDLLAHRTIPHSLLGTNPRTLMGELAWDELRHDVYKKNNYCCFACGVHKLDADYHNWLEAHEAYDYDMENCVATLKEVVALCHKCHNFIHIDVLMARSTFSKKTRDKIRDVVTHGMDLLTKAGLDPTPVKIMYMFPYFPDRFRSLYDYDAIVRKYSEQPFSCLDKWKLFWKGEYYPKEK